jgi:hypothetical protein
MIINEPFMHSKLPIWEPKWSGKNTTGEPVVLLSVSKVRRATPIFIVEFTKANSLIGQRFAIHRGTAMSYPQVTNGKIPCYEVPLSAFEGWETEKELEESIYEG